MPSDLKWIESLLYRLVTAPSGVAEGLACESALEADGLSRVIRGDDRLSAEQRVDIYANMYFYRILDVLKEDFPATSKLLGESNFHNLVTGYLIEYTPTHFSIAEAGRHLADFLRDHSLRSDFQCVADLARLERALSEVFHAADAVALTPDDMRAIAPSEWAAMRMKLHPAVQILNFEWDVGPILRGLDAAQLPEALPRSVTILVSRNHNRVEFREIDAVDRSAMTLLAGGTTFAELCDAIASALDSADPAAEINARFEAWLRGAIIVAS